MLRFPTSFHITLLVLLLVLKAHGYRTRNSFQNFFPDVKHELQFAVNNNCSNDFELYRNERITLYGQYCVKMFSCVMEVATEYTKANFASAGVLLGLTPTILATIGSTTPELALLSSRRPVLTLLIDFGSPAVNALRALDYNKSITDFKQTERAPDQMRFTTLKKSPRQQHVCVLLEYFFALAAVANLAQLSFVINRNTIAIMSCDNSDMLVELWIGLALVAHVFGVATFFTRSPPLYFNPKKNQFLYEPRKWIKNELSPCAVHNEEKLRWRPENGWFVGLSWFVTLWTILHLSFGTLMFSSLYFVGTPDAAYIIGRFLASALVCRTIVAFELAGIKSIREELPDRELPHEL